MSAGSALYVVVPGDLDTRTGGYGYDRRIVAGLRDRGWSVDVRELDDGFPRPDRRQRARHAARRACGDSRRRRRARRRPRARRAARRGRSARRRGCGSSRSCIIRSPPRPASIPTLAAALEIERAARARRGRDAVVVTSRATAAALADYGVAADRITVVEPGTDPAPLARGSRAASVDEPQPQPQPPTWRCSASRRSCRARGTRC